MPTFDFRFQVPASVKAVAEFHRDTKALKLLTPPPTFVQLHEIEPMSEGSISKFTLWIGPLPLHWTAEHHNVSERGFTDVQLAGPVKQWEHTHSFIPRGDALTEIHEHIEYEHRSDIWGWVTRLLFAKPNLYFMFMYRKWVTLRNLK